MTISSESSGAMPESVRLLITDLDNTLYDWVSFYAVAFYKMVDVAVQLLKVDEERLLDDFRDVHRKYGNSEQPFALLETRAARETFPSLSYKERAKALDPAFYAFNKARKDLLKLYPGVVETLKKVSSTKIPLVAHTEATVPNALFRLKSLKIHHYFSCLYSPTSQGNGHPNPESLGNYEKLDLRIVSISEDLRKPNPKVILDICSTYSVQPKNALYIGDSIARDIGMAVEAGVQSAWAKYGTMYEKSLWDSLVRITHWNDADVKRAEKARAKYGESKPSVVLEERMDELLEKFHFGRTAEEIGG